MTEAPADPALVLTLSCPDRPGVVAAVAGLLFEAGGTILEAQQFEDAGLGRFFMRVVLAPAAGAPGAPGALEEVAREGMADLAARFGMEWRLRPRAQRRRVLVLVSRFDHCLVDLLHRRRLGELAMEVAGVVSNHPREALGPLDLDGAPFHHLPVTRETKLEQETALWALVQSSGAELVVLARYMQVLSEGLSAKLRGRCINIHHSFLPGFKGAAPYTQAHERGVKIIGATAHYVTGDLDEGPIIEQDVERVSHRDGPADLARRGRDIERRVLARAVRLHLEDRVLISGRKTVVFGE